ncbi:MAG: TonB-dependent receptor, partial [Bacteroidales bacterium]|nr:TonB-dependent receptor [Bacteroidales bacterium]
MKNKFISLVLLLVCFNVAFAQQKQTISGHIKDAETGEELIGATIFINELKTGGTTNVYGFYSLTIPEGKYTIEYSYIGFVTQIFEIDLVQSIKNNILLLPAAVELEQVIITSEAADKNIKSAEMGVVKMKPNEIKAIPVLFGEQDILKTIQLMPGVQSAGEGNSGFYVRGGGADQNLILLDEAPVYNASHLLGFFSVFNSDAIKDMK